jgi:DNA-binding transcriptional regulator LsrR (DeoR family)
MDIANGAKDDWLNILSKAATNKLPEGYKTTAMLAKEYNVTIRQVRSALEKALDSGEVEKIKVNISGCITNAFKIKTPPN